MTGLTYQAKGFGSHPVHNRQPKQRGILCFWLKILFLITKVNSICGNFGICTQIH